MQIIVVIDKRYVCYRYLLGYAAIVAALEVRLRCALGTILGQLIAVVATVVLAVAEQPLGYAAIVGLAGTALPAIGTVALAAHVRRLIGVVATIVIEVAHPQLLYAASVLAGEFRVRIAGAFVCKSKGETS